MMHGMGNSCSVEGSLRKPFAASPRLCAALTILLALLPSRETPQATRNCSSGIQAPWWASTIASAAAPHSTASICNTVAVRLMGPRPNQRRMVRNMNSVISLKKILSCNSCQPLEHGDNELDRASLARCDLRLCQRPAGKPQCRALSHGPMISADRVVVALQPHRGRVRRAALGKAGDAAVIVQDCGHALRRYRKFGNRFDGADHGSELLTFDCARLQAHFHARLNALAAIRRNVQNGVERCAFGFDHDDRRTDVQYRSWRHLDLKHASFDRADHRRIAAQLSGQLVHLPARLVEVILGLFDVALALGLEVGPLFFQFENFVLSVFLALLCVREFVTAILDVTPRGISLC